MMTKFTLVLFLLGAILVQVSTSFSVLATTTTRKQQLHSKNGFSTNSNTKLAVTAGGPGAGANPNSIVQDDDTQGVTPNQIKILRKEISKRQARKILAQEYYVADDEGNNNEEEIENFLTNVCNSLLENELVQVRGVSINNKREVYDTAHRLAYDLSVKLQKEVTVVIIKGHAVTYYCPMSNSDNNPSSSNNNNNKRKKIILRTSYKEGAWTRRVKAPRDHRGQIIKN